MQRINQQQLLLLTTNQNAGIITSDFKMVIHIILIYRKWISGWNTKVQITTFGFFIQNLSDIISCFVTRGVWFVFFFIEKLAIKHGKIYFRFQDGRGEGRMGLRLWRHNRNSSSGAWYWHRNFVIGGYISSAGIFVCYFWTSFHRKSLQSLISSSCCDVMSALLSPFFLFLGHFESGSDFSMFDR